MPIEQINGVRLYWERRGDAGPAVIFVHGSWGDHHNWDAVVPAFARSFQVFTYDRRGHSQSERPGEPGRIAEDAADLGALITARGLAPAHVVGNSGGAIVVLKLAASQPDLLASIVVHEPPLFGLIPDHPMIPAARDRIGAVLAKLRAGDMEAGARQFVETIAFGPGTWGQLAPEMRETFVFNAPTFLDELDEPDDTALSVDVGQLARLTQPVLVTQGDQSAPFFGAILETLIPAMPRARRHTFHGAGHVPHLTAPDEYVRVVGEFLASVAAV
jgi:pimeloyl-ACP methyl ester carboxylesterase